MRAGWRASRPMQLWSVVCEDESDAELATTLADRVILESLALARAEELDRFRHWRGLSEARGELAFTKWTDTKTLAEKRGLTVHGKYGKGHERGAYVEAMKVVKLAKSHKAASRPDGLLLVRDTDGHAERVAGFRRARVESTA